MNKQISVFWILLFLVGSCFGTVESARCETLESLDFDILRTGDSLTVWVDMEPLLTEERVDQMKQGIDLALQYELTLLRPRRIWGAQKMNSSTGYLRMGYRLVAEDFFLSHSLSTSDTDRHFLSLAPLGEYLTDSIQPALCNVDSLDQSTRYYLELKITAISLTAFNLASEENAAEGQESSPIRYLFKKFLEMTDFGREEFQFKSRLFSLSEIVRK
jgi:hypothetical protein